MNKYIPKLKFYILFFLAMLLPWNLSGVTYGSITKLLYYTSALVITGATNDIRGLAVFDGLTFQDAATNCNFNSFFPTRGNISLNGGILYLDRDMPCADSINILTAGKIYGNGSNRSIFLPNNLKSWNYTYTFQDVCLSVDSNLLLNDSFTFQSTCTIDGHGKQIDLRGGGELYVAQGARLTLKNVSILGLQDTNVHCIGSDSVLELKNSNLILSSTYSFTQGIIDVYQESKIQGAHGFVYQSPQELTIHSKSKLMLDRNVTFSYDSLAASKEKLILEDDSSILHLNGCTLCSTRTGLLLQTGRVIFEDLVTVRNEAQVQAEAMELKETLSIDVLAGAIFDFTDGLLEYES